MLLAAPQLIASGGAAAMNMMLIVQIGFGFLGGGKRRAEGMELSRRLLSRLSTSLVREKLWGGRRRSWHLHRPYELMEVAPWPKSMISAEA